MFTPYGRREVKIVFIIFLCSSVSVVFSSLYQGSVYALIPLIPLILLTGLALWFFRDPERNIPYGEEKMVSPADGRVVEVCESEHPFVGNAKKVAIFMSLLDVHVNRVPLSGRVLQKEYKKGDFLKASEPDASHRNEAVDMVLETEFGKILVRQVAGIVARRIVNGTNIGDDLQKGERYGMIKYGSRIEVFVPMNLPFKITVKVGDRVKAGETVVGVFER